MHRTTSWMRYTLASRSHRSGSAAPSPRLITTSNQNPSMSSLGYDEEKETKILLNEELINAVRRNDPEDEKMDAIEELLDRGADINFKDANHGNNTPLHAATHKGQVAVIKLLLGNKAIVHIRNSANRTALDIARKCDKANRDEIINVLEQHLHPNPVQDLQLPTTSIHNFDPFKLDTIDERMFTFVVYFVQEFEMKVFSYQFILEGSFEKAGKFSDTFMEEIEQAWKGDFNGLLQLFVELSRKGATIEPKIGGRTAKAIKAFQDNRLYRSEALNLVDIMAWCMMDDISFQRLLVHAACDLFQSYEMQFSHMTSNFGLKVALHNLAKDAVNRSFDHFAREDCKVHLSESILLGRSKIEPVWGVMPVHKSKVKTPGYDLIWRVSDLTLKWKSSSMFSKPGLVTREGIQAEKRHFTKDKIVNPFKYGYRRLLSTEDVYEKCFGDYVEGHGKKARRQFTEYQFLLKVEDLQVNINRVLEHINQIDSMLMEDRLPDILQENKKDLLEVIHLLRSATYISEQNRTVLKRMKVAIQDMKLGDVLYYLDKSLTVDRAVIGKTFNSANVGKREQECDFSVLHDEACEPQDVESGLWKSNVETSPKFHGTTNSTVYTPMPLSPIFVGREKDLKEVHDAFHVYNKSTVVIGGLRGVGKSQLARKYAEKYFPDCYDDVLWIDASSEVAIKKSFVRLLRENGSMKMTDQNGAEKSLQSIQEDVYDFFKNRCSLFVFDDARSYDAVRPFLPVSLPSKVSMPFVLITTSISQLTRATTDIFKWNLSEFSRQESVTFIIAALNFDGVEDHSHDEDIEELATLLSNHPLALWQSMSYIRHQNKDFNVRDLITLYKEKPLEVMTASYGAQKNMLDILELTLKDVQLDLYGTQALSLLFFMAYIANVAEIRFVQTIALGTFDQYLPPVVDTLERHSLLQWKNDQTTITISLIVQDMVRMLLKESSFSVDPSEDGVIRGTLVLLRNYVQSEENEVHLCLVHLISLWKHACHHDHLIGEYIADSIENPAAHIVYFYLSAAEDCHHIIDKVLRHIRDTFPQHLHAVVHTKRSDDWMSLHQAAKNGCFEMAKVLLEVGGAKMDAKTKDGHTPLQLAALAGHSDIVRLILGKMAKGTDSELLHWAVKNCHLSAAQMLTEFNDIDVNILSADGSSVLHVAAEKGYRDICGILLDKGADVKAADARSMVTPLQLAALAGHIDIVRLMLDKTAKDGGSELLHWAVNRHSVGVVKMLAGIVDIDLNAPGTNGFSVLHTAAGRGYLDICAILLDKGAEVNVTDVKYDTTPLQLASKEGYQDVVRLLLRNKANVTMVNNYAGTPLHWAVMGCHLDIVQMLAETDDVDLDAQDLNGFAALHVGAQKGYRPICEILLYNGANIDISSETLHGCTPLHLAAYHGHKDVVRLLLHKKASVSVADSSGSAPVHWARQGRRFDIVRLFAEFDASIGNMQWVKDCVAQHMEAEKNAQSSDTFRSCLKYCTLFEIPFPPIPQDDLLLQKAHSQKTNKRKVKLLA